MNRKPRFHIRKPEIRLFDTTGLDIEVIRSLNIAIIAVTLSMVFFTITASAAWTGYLRLLGADAMMIGVIAAIPVMASALQLFASYILERFQARRQLFLFFGLIARLFWCLIGLVPIIIPEQQAHSRLYLLMALLGVSSCSASFVNVSFYSLMGDLVPLRIRGRYFSSRQAVALVAGVFAGLFVSVFMDRVTGFGGYAIVFIIAGIFGALDICCFFFVKWPPMAKREEQMESMGTMVRSVLRDKGYMRIVGYFTLWAFAVNISSPFTNVYLLEYVKMSYTEITLITQILPNLTTVLVIGWWGRKMDLYGNQPIVQLAGLFCMIMPLTYLLAGPRSFLAMPITYVLSGINWPTTDLGQQNMYLAKAPARNRSMYVAVFFACTQLLGNALSNFVGGALMKGPLLSMESLGWQLFGYPMTRYHFLFILSGFLRILCVLVMLPNLREDTDTPAVEVVQDLLRNAHARVLLLTRSLHITWLRKQYRKKQSTEEASIDNNDTKENLDESKPNHSEPSAD